MTETIEIFKPGIAELRSVAERLRGITIKGVDDVEGYAAAKDAKKELAQWRIDITKSGTKFRAEALAYQREVIRQEKEHLEIITPVEDNLKAMIQAVDEAKAREERKVLIPSRKAMLAEIEVEMTDDELLALDEKEFEGVFNTKKMQYLEAREAKRREEENEKRHQEELEKAKAEAAAKAIEEERLRVEREAQAKAAEEKRLEDDRKAEEKKIARNKRYKEWLEKNGRTEENKGDFYIEREGTKFTLYKVVDEIVIE